MSAQELEPILNQVRRLSQEDQLLLIKRLAKIVAETRTGTERRNLIYGKYRNGTGGRMSSEKDFDVAEWRPSEKDLNGL